MIKKPKKWVVILLGMSLLIGVISACSGKKKETVTTPRNTSQDLDSSKVLQLDSTEDPDVTEFGGNDGLLSEEMPDIPEDLLSEVRRALLAEDYPKVLSLLENREDDASSYYRGIAYFVMMQEKQNYNVQERAGYAQNAESIFLDLADNTPYDNLRARALLWYGVTLQIQYKDYSNLKEAVSRLYEIKNYPNSRVYNDSVYYLGNLHAKMGWYGPARYYYRKVMGLNSNGDNLIYDYTDKTFYSTEEASEAGLDRLGRYMDGSHEDYQYDPNYIANTESDLQ